MVPNSRVISIGWYGDIIPIGKAKVISIGNSSEITTKGAQYVKSGSAILVMKLDQPSIVPVNMAISLYSYDGIIEAHGKTT